MDYCKHRLTSTLSSVHNKIAPFQGKDGTECEEFVLAVQREVLSVAKYYDDAWIARFAGTFMMGGALRWHVGLPLEQKRSWRALRQALFEKYPLEEKDRIMSM